MNILHVFDMDGTLLPGTSASLEIARALNRLPELLVLERSFAAGTLTTYEFAIKAHDIHTQLTPTLIANIFHSSPWIDGIPRVLADIKARGEDSAVITMSPDFFAELLTTLGIDEVHASRFPPLPLRHPPQRADILSPIDKVAIVDDMLTRRHLRRDQCVAYGDSSSDLPLFHHLTNTVAVNASAELRAVASVCLDGDDLWKIYQAARAHLDHVL